MGMLRIRKRLIAFLLLSGSLGAQSSTPGDAATVSLLIQQVKALQKETRELRERVKTLEAGEAKAQPAAPEVATASPAVQPPQTSPEPAATEPSPGLMAALHNLHGIQWRGFGEVNYKVLNQRQPELGTYGFTPGSAGNFYTGDFGLFLTAHLSDKASVLSEIVFEEGNAQSYSVNLRRVLLKYDYNDHLKMSFGRYQTAIGYYNWAFRSAAWLQTTADRPLVMEFASNGGLLPTQAVGVEVTGAIPSGKLDLNYIFEYGSSDTVRPDINGGGLTNDENDGNHLNFGFFLRPAMTPGLQLGGPFFHDKISDSDVSLADRYGQSIFNSYVVYAAHGIESLNEAFLIRQVQVGTGAAFNTPAFYSQISKQWKHLRPFFRYQYVNASQGNSIFNDVGLRAGPSFGARYDLNEYIAFKAQLDHTLRRGLPDLNGLHLQAAFTF
jgi:hypothetical protein